MASSSSAPSSYYELEEFLKDLSSTQDRISKIDRLGSVLLNPFDSSAFQKLVEKIDARPSLPNALKPFAYMFNAASQLALLKFKDPPALVIRSFASELRYWNNLRKLLIYVDKCSNADKVVPNWGPLVIKIKTAFNEIAKDHIVASRKREISKKPRKALELLLRWVEKIRHFKVDVGAVLNQLSTSCCSLEWHFRLHPSELLRSISGILEYICLQHPGDQNLDQDQRQKLKAFDNDMILPLSCFLDAALPDIKSVYPRNPMIVSLFAHIGFVALQIANQSFHYCCEKMEDLGMAKKSKVTGILDLQAELDPLTAQFLKLIFKFLRALNRIRPDRAKYRLSSFLHYILHDATLYNDFQKKLEPLITFVINESDEEPSSSEDMVQSWVPEIRAVLIMVGLASRDSLLLHVSSRELRARVYLLDLEVFLKQQLMNGSMITLQNKVDELAKLQTYLGMGSDQPQQKTENEQKQTFIMFFVDVCRDLASLYLSSLDENIEADNTRNFLLMLLLKIVIFKAESSCMELLKSMNANPSMMGLEKDLIETIHERMKVFGAFLTHQKEKMANTKGVELIFTHIEASARGITSLYYTFVVHKTITEQTVRYLLDKMTIIKEELREICPGIPRPDFPKVPGLDFIDFLLENLLEKLNHSPDSIALVNHHIERIQLDLGCLRSFLVKLDTEHLELKDLGARITDVAYQVEFIIDCIEVGIGDHWQHLLWLHDLLEEIKLIKIQSTIIHENNSDARIKYVGQISSNMISQVSLPETGQIVKCRMEDEEAIVNRLRRGSPQRDVISIVGMPGIGKTTLAIQVYNNPNVAYHFHIRAWCSVSREYTKRQLLLELLTNIGGLADNVHEMKDEDIALRLYQRLKKNKYLIVMDDVWDDEAWNELQESFPDDRNGSRILMTSRLGDEALKANLGSDPYCLRLLSADESWKLFEKRFHGGCPEELLVVGKEIVKSCKGLSLAIVAVAGLLERTEKKQDIWKKVAESLSSQIINDPQTQCKDIIQLSYNHLPDNLKACFLYFGAFLEDKDIPACKLIKLWIAEGFIRTTKQKSLEDIAEDYLNDLIGRSLVTISKEGSRRRVKSCRIHDLLRDFCLSKAKDENFLQVITRNDEPYNTFSPYDHGADFVDHYPSNPVTYRSRRMCFFVKRKHFFNSSPPHGPCTHSLIFSAISDDMYPRRPYDISFVPRHFSLLKVLDLETINMGVSFPAGMELLTKLRYLAVCGDIEFIPASIANLQKLETLIVKGLMGKVNLPDSVWSMSKLRHIHVNDHVDINLQDDKVESVLQLDNLVTFSSPVLSYGNHTEKVMRRLPNLRKLGCIFLESWDLSTNYNKFPELDFLVQLESLKIFYSGRILNPGILTLPRNLKKLTLSNFRLPWSYSSAVGRLQNLEVLKLLSQAFEGEIWDMREGEFLKLKYLKLDSLNIVHWNASNNHLPNLQKLVLRNCKALEDPYDFLEIPTLKTIEMQSCGRSIEDSVRKIQEEEGIDWLNIIINDRDNI